MLSVLVGGCFVLSAFINDVGQLFGVRNCAAPGEVVDVAAGHRGCAQRFGLRTVDLIIRRGHGITRISRSLNVNASALSGELAHCLTSGFVGNVKLVDYRLGARGCRRTSRLAVIRSMPVGMRTVASGPYWSWVLDENFYFCSSVLGRDCNSGCIGATLFALISIP